MKHRGRRPGRAGGREDVGVDVPLRLRADPAPRRRPARLPEQFTIYDQADAVRLTGYVIRDLGLDPKGSRPARSTPRSARPRTTALGVDALRRAGPGDLRAQDRRRLPRVPGPPPAGRGHGLRRPPRQHGHASSSSHPDVLEHYQRRFKHVLVDEYQDTNTVQNELVLLLAERAPQRLRRGRRRPVDLRVPRRRHAEHPRVRGGVPRRHGRRARAELPLDPDDPRRRQRGHRQQPRAASRRSCGPTGATATDRPLPRRRRGRRGPVGRAARSPGSTTAATCAGATSPSSTGPTRRAGCSRSTSSGTGIPYKVVGGTRFYDRREVKDALAYLKAVVNPRRRGVGKRVLNVPKRGVGDTTVGKLDAYATGHGLPLHRRPAPGRRRRASAARRSGASRVPRPARRRRRPRRRRPPAPLLEALLERLRLPRRARRPSTRSRPRAGSRTWPSSSASAEEFETSTSSSSRSASWPTPTRSTATTARSCS